MEGGFNLWRVSPQILLESVACLPYISSSQILEWIQHKSRLLPQARKEFFLSTLLSADKGILRL